ncbi:hypothetical protein ACIPW9_01550 [Streptomyces sp. NPDC090052]|uniref:hypothetical protein n=1 Tax=unclassified Streptomyces TaxID=2593676 RepID=UPI002E22B93E|nr:hypothetical protein OG372_10970 [Streptomyces sp. NBC_01020]
MPASMLDRVHALANEAKTRTRPRHRDPLNCPSLSVRPAFPDRPPRGHSWS